MQRIRLAFSTLLALVMFVKHAECQSDRIAGQCPMKWITIKHSNAPGRVVFYNGQNYSADFEDVSAKIWLPVVLHDRFKLLTGLYYRTEQIEFESRTNSELSSISNWNLRAAGIDIKTISKVSETRSLIVAANLSYSATIQSVRLTSSPMNYSVSAVFMTRKSPMKETGFGLLYSGNSNSLPFLPVFVWNETFSKTNGIEISLPYKLAWRYNLSSQNIFHLKAEAVRRNYYVGQADHKQCRRLDVDLGFSYNRLIKHWAGFELFSGYRQNLSNELPNNISMKTGSGFVFTAELFLLPGLISSRHKLRR